MSRTAESILALVSPCPVTGCWFWMGRWDRYGYGVVKVGGKTAKAHRVALKLLGGQHLLKRHDVDHLCRCRACVNPDHLRAVTPSKNKRMRFIREKQDAKDFAAAEAAMVHGGAA